MIEELYETFYQELLRWAVFYSGNCETAEELIQETFLRAMQHIHTLEELSLKQKRAWLYRTAKNLYIDQTRHQRFETVTELVPESMQEQAEMTILEWDGILSALPQEEGMLFVMRYLEGYNARELGELFSIPAGTVRWKLSSARKHIRELLQNREEESHV